MMSRRLGRTAGVAFRVVWFGVVGLGACGDDPQTGHSVDSTVASLKGRAFSADTGEPLRKANVVVGDHATEADDDGAFSLKHPASDRRVELHAAQHAPVSKAAPGSDGYIELMAKKYDVQQEIDATVGGEAKAANGAKLQVDGEKLVDDSGASAKEATLSVAAPNPKKAQELGSVPGEFKGEKMGHVGNVSTESPVFVQVSSGEKELKLKASAKAKLTLPAHDKTRDKAQGSALYRFDEASGRWLDAGPVTSGTDEAGNPIYEAEIDRFGWFTVGTFFEGLTCVRACVVDAAGKAVPAARVTASGVDLFTQSSGFADAEGCFALEVPANARLSMSVQAQGGFSDTMLVQSANGGTLADPGSCQALEDVVLAARTDTPCPSGFTVCGASCVDLSSDSQHCGACSTVCEDICAASMCEVRKPDGGLGSLTDGGVPTAAMDSGVKSDAGVKPSKDGGVGAARDGGVAVPVEAGTGLDGGQSGGGGDGGGTGPADAAQAMLDGAILT